MIQHPSPFRRFLPRRRGMALLLVMIGLVVCTILTAGFLSTQGTSVGIARNERDAAKCHAIAQTGVDMCYWLIRNKSNWRETMAPGPWLANVPIGDGTVSVSVASGDGTNNFANDPTQPAILTSTGTYDSRAFTLTATIRPTGGGTVYSAGNFISGNILVGNGDLLTAATVDSYNSSVASYNALFPGTNAAFVSNSVASNSLLVYFPSVFRGSYTAGTTALLSNVVGLLGGASGPAATGTQTESRNPGTVIFPNTAGLAYRGAMSKTVAGTASYGSPGTYDSITATTGTVNINATGIYNITGNVALTNSTAKLTFTDGVIAVVVVNGNLSVSSGAIQLLGTTSQVAFYVKGNITLAGGSLNNNGATSRATLFGGSSGGTIQITGTNGAMYGSIYAPQHDMTLSSSSPKFFGAVVAKSLTVKDSAAVHFDEALRTLKISNLTGGSAAPGTADYRLSVLGGPGIQH